MLSNMVVMITRRWVAQGIGRWSPTPKVMGSNPILPRGELNTWVTAVHHVYFIFNWVSKLLRFSSILMFYLKYLKNYIMVLLWHKKDSKKLAGPHRIKGKVSEWSIVVALKASEVSTSVGSNPTLSDMVKIRY